MDPLLIVEDEPALSEALVQACQKLGREAIACRTGRQAIEAMTRGPVAMAVLDIGLPDGNGLDILERLRERRPDMPVLVITAHGNLENAIAARKRGASGYLVKPFGLDQFIRDVQALLQEPVSAAPVARPGASLLVGASRAMQDVFVEIAHACASDGHVLITGETGTGKTEVARVIHAQGGRATGPFVELHCHALPETLLESELFGHERGAFTGANAARTGHVERAAGGTLFLDEVGDLPAAIQTKLLRLVEDRRFVPVGARVDRTVDLRIIAATHVDLDAGIRGGRFRGDLFYRLRVLHIHLPPLRERKEDLPLLCSCLLARAVPGRKITVGAAAMQRVAAYEWPGNVRELRNAMEYAAARAPGLVIGPDHLPPEVRFGPGNESAGDTKLDEALRRWLRARIAEGADYDALHGDLEQRILRELLRIFGDKPSIMARDLKMNRATLLARRRRYGIGS
jgi:DNA-binding NtrC family response regulator